MAKWIFSFGPEGDIGMNSGQLFITRFAYPPAQPSLDGLA
jgi:hypothetical protein